MLTKFDRFEKIVRQTFTHKTQQDMREAYAHPFDIRNINPKIQNVARELFDDGHYAQATFEVFKFIDKEIQKHSNIQDTGFKLMMQAFGGDKPSISVTKMSNVSQVDEQKGFQFLFAGSMLAVRNPRGHEYSIKDDIDLCLDHLGLASLLIRKLEETGYI